MGTCSAVTTHVAGATFRPLFGSSVHVVDTSEAPPRPRLAHRLLLTLAITELAAGFAWFTRASRPIDGQGTDISPIFTGVRAAWAGVDPYSLDPNHPLIYPFTALVLLAPAAWAAIPPAVLDACWMGLGAGLLTWALTRDRLWSPALLLLFSPAMFQAVQNSQWSPLMLALTLLPAGAGIVYACKPSTAVWLFAYKPSWRALVEAVAMVAVSLMIWPMWPWAWLQGLADAAWTLSPLSITGGPLMLLALLRWRLPEARLLLAMACMPHTPLVYETLPLGLIPRTWVQAGVLWSGMLIARLGQGTVGTNAGPEVMPVIATWIVWCVYLPALVMILMRPNRA